MEKIKEQKQSQLKNSWSESYKRKVLNKVYKEYEDYKNNSPSWIFINRLGGVILDLLGWLLLIIALYIGWKSGKWMDIDCSRISVDLCNSCYGQAKEIIGKINNMPLGIPNISITGMR